MVEYELRKPVVSVVMPVYNAERYLSPAVESILTQTFSDFEFVIINDGSTDGTGRMAEEFAARDGRIRVFHQENRGISAALNRGIELSRGDYLARMDGDDISERGRLQRQVEFLNSHSDIGLVGTCFTWMSEDGEIDQKAVLPQDDLGIRWRLLLTCPFAHPTIMVRRRILTDRGIRYSSQWDFVEDYEIYPHILRWTKGANLAESEHRIRLHAGSICASRKEQQRAKHLDISMRIFSEELPELPITREDVRQLVGIYLRLGKPWPEQDPRRIGLSAIQLRVLKAFSTKYQGKDGLEAILRQETRQMMSVISEVPLSWNLCRLVLSLVKMNPELGRLLIRGARQRLGRFQVNKKVANV